MYKFFIFFLILLNSHFLKARSIYPEINLSAKIFRPVPYSSQYSEVGSIIRSVDFRSVNDLIPQIEKIFKKELQGQKLQDRNESHITVITPPEGKTDFIPGKIGIDKVISTNELIKSYKNILQYTYFDIKCLGMRSNNKGSIVFYLVIESSDILNIRKEISSLVKSKDPTIPFEPIKNYYPHITIGFIGSDIYDQPKGEKTCVADVNIQ